MSEARAMPNQRPAPPSQLDERIARRSILAIAILLIVGAVGLALTRADALLLDLAALAQCL